MLFEWDDDIGNIPKQPIDSVRPDDQITGGDIAMAVCVFPIYCYFVVPSIISDVFSSHIMSLHIYIARIKKESLNSRKLILGMFCLGMG
jgi:hypothetical protein